MTAGVSSKLIGDHQAGNAETAVAAAVQLQSQGFAQITETSIVKGLETACLAGRFQVSQISLTSGYQSLPHDFLSGKAMQASTKTPLLALSRLGFMLS